MYTFLRPSAGRGLDEDFARTTFLATEPNEAIEEIITQTGKVNSFFSLGISFGPSVRILSTSLSTWISLSPGF